MEVHAELEVGAGGGSWRWELEVGAGGGSWRWELEVGAGGGSWSLKNASTSCELDVL